jgi:hypothetical protein
VVKACEQITFNAETAEPAEKIFILISQRVLRVLRLTSDFFTADLAERSTLA